MRLGPREVDGEAERLLSPEARSGLPIREQIALYLDPFALFKDASRGTPAARRQALSWNRRMRWMLLAYVRRWLFIAACLFLPIGPVETVPVILVAGALGVGCCVALTVSACSAAAYLLLGSGAHD